MTFVAGDDEQSAGFFMKSLAPLGELALYVGKNVHKFFSNTCNRANNYDCYQRRYQGIFNRRYSIFFTKKSYSFHCE